MQKEFLRGFHYDGDGIEHLEKSHDAGSKENVPHGAIRVQKGRYGLGWPHLGLHFSSTILVLHLSVG